MELSWSTFLLEIINFLVLVWILQRFLYKPLMDVIARRRAGIEQTLADAKALHEEAEELKQEYGGRLTDWNRERQQVREDLNREINAERTRRKAELQSTLDQQREKARLADERRRADEVRAIEEKALRQGAGFAARLLKQGAGPDTEARLVALVLSGLSQLPAERIKALSSYLDKQHGAITVTSAFALTDQQRKSLEMALVAISGPDAEIRFEQDQELLAGLSIVIGAWVLGTNLRDELAGFVELERGN